jgi:hypothetical protein
MKTAKLTYKDNSIIVDIPESVYLLHEVSNDTGFLSGDGNTLEPNCLNDQLYNYLDSYFTNLARIEFNNLNLNLDGFMIPKITDIECNFE